LLIGRGSRRTDALAQGVGVEVHAVLVRTGQHGGDWRFMNGEHRPTGILGRVVFLRADCGGCDRGAGAAAVILIPPPCSVSCKTVAANRAGSWMVTEIG